MMMELPEIEKLIPQRAPILEVDRVVEASAEGATCELVVRGDNYFVSGGHLLEPGLIEHCAQSAAAYAGYAVYLKGDEPHLGFIGEVKKCKFYSLPEVGRTLTTRIDYVSEMAGVTLVKGTIRSNDEMVMECQMKIFLKE